MSCLTVVYTREGGSTSTFERISDFTSTLSYVGGIDPKMWLKNGVKTSTIRKGGISCRMWQVCSTGIRKPYLEISPTIVWVLAGQTSNEVYSNTTWNID